MDPVLVNPDKVYLISYVTSSGKEEVFEVPDGTKEVKNYIVVGGPPPMKRMKVELGVKIYRVPDGEDPMLTAQKMGGYACKGYPLSEPLVRDRL